MTQIRIINAHHVFFLYFYNIDFCLNSLNKKILEFFILSFCLFHLVLYTFKSVIMSDNNCES